MISNIVNVFWFITWKNYVFLFAQWVCVYLRFEYAFTISWSFYLVIYLFSRRQHPLSFNVRRREIQRVHKVLICVYLRFFFFACIIIIIISYILFFSSHLWPIFDTRIYIFLFSPLFTDVIYQCTPYIQGHQGSKSCELTHWWSLIKALFFR